MILVKEAITALGMLKSSSSDSGNSKGDSGTEQTIQLALSKLSPPTQLSLQQEYDNNGDGNDKTHSHNHDIVVPQTPIGSSLVSPPLPKKMPYDFASPSPSGGV